MTSWDITGTWAGEYWYDSSPQFPVLPPRTAFTLVARQGWFGRFSGTVQDACVGDLPSEAAVAGRITHGGLRFQKQYPFACVWWEDRLLALGEQVEAVHGLRPDAEPVPAPIWYRGEYEPVTEAAGGIWQVHHQLVECYRAGQLVGFLMPGYSGGWRMERQRT